MRHLFDPLVDGDGIVRAKNPWTRKVKIICQILGCRREARVSLSGAGFVP